MFDAKIITELAAPLQRDNVKARTQGSRQVSYIESWHAIAEANRIFGFGEWSSETLDIKCITEHNRPIGADKKPGWGVSYIAKVRITIIDMAAGERLIREGVGAGHGIDVDVGHAHESAVKEAESDALKRALRTFGNQFGLALYDKEQTNVTDGNGGDVSSRFIYERLYNTMKSTKTEAAYQDWKARNDADIKSLSEGYFAMLKQACADHRGGFPKMTLSQKATEAGKPPMPDDDLGAAS